MKKVLMIRFEIITPDAQRLCQNIFDQLHRTATIMDAHGAYSGTDKKMIICVLEKQKSPELEDMIKPLSKYSLF